MDLGDVCYYPGNDRNSYGSFKIMEGAIMKKLLFTIIIFILVAGFAQAKEPEYEVTIHVVYNSIPASEIAELVENQLRKHKDACKVDIKIKNPEDYILTVTDGTWTDLIDSSPITQLYTDGDTASD